MKAALPAGSDTTQVKLDALPPLALYVHLPWCVRKCPYCDFNSHELRHPLPEREYVDALVADLESALPQIWGRTVHSVFFGGGTPSLLTPSGIDAILSAARARLSVAPAAEVTLEANPGTVDAQRFSGYRAAGVNRLSIGIQSLNDVHLRSLGRIHDSSDAHRAIESAMREFDNVNLDFMYALPGQSLAEVEAEFDAAVARRPQHLSAYQLTIEPNTLFHRYPPNIADEDLAADMQDAIEARLNAAGYEHYETSAFAQTGRRCAHNLNYWRFGDYLGIGAGAHSKLSFPDRIERSMRYKQPRQYIEQALAGTSVQESHVVALHDLPFEFMMNALRLCDGFALHLYEERTGLTSTTVLGTLQRAERDGLIERDHRLVRPSVRGRRFLNELLQRFLP